MLKCRLTQVFCSFLVGLLFQGCNSQLSAAICTNSDQVVLGSAFGLNGGGGSGNGYNSDDNCSFSSQGQSASDMDLYQEGSQYTFYSTGSYTYECTTGESWNLTVVPAQYIVPLCKQCSTRRSQFQLTTGDSLHWVLLPEVIGSDMPDCSMTLRESDGKESMITFLDDSAQYQFQEAGTFYLYCKEDEGFNATIIIKDEDESEKKDVFLPLVYTHVALMAAAFAVLLPIGVFLRHYDHSLAYFVILPIAWILSIIGLVVVVIYIQLTDKHHVQLVIHAVVGYILMFVFVLGLPLLLLHHKLRVYHTRLGHVVMVFGLKNILTGLAILPAPFIAGVSLCLIYGCWLIVMISFYIFYSAKKADSKYVAAKYTSFEMKDKTKSNGSLTHKESSSSLQSKGPQPLTKNVISDTKMVQLRKKSMDFLESQRQMKQLNAELGLKHQLAKELDLEEETLKLRMEQKLSKSPTPDQDSPDGYDLDDSRAPLHPSSPEMDDPFSPEEQDRQRRSCSSDDEEDDRKEIYPHHHDRSLAAITRASTFNYGSKSDHGLDAEENYPESDTGSEKGGSVRITRHSKRARVKLENIFNKSDLIETAEVASTDPPSFNITPSTPPLNHPMMTCSTPEGRSNTVNVELPNTDKAIGGRRRKTAMTLPILDAPILEQPSLGAVAPALGCPFHSSLSASGKSPSASPRPCRRGISPSGSAGAEDANCPRKRKKKVSVAQIEATVVPPTPISLEPPPHLSLSRSSSFNNIHMNQDAFADNAFHAIMQISLNGIVCANSVGDIVFWSAGASKMFGYTPGEAVGSSLEMIIPMSYKERHRNGISNRTEKTMKYIRKHSYTPEEQKHARLYAVHGVTKGGHEFPVEVNVTSFVLDGEMFYTGVISELAKPKDSKRSSVSSSMSDLNEVALQQRALAVGAQMKISHKLRSAEHISRRELERVLKGSLGTSFDVDPTEMEQMITGIMKAGDPDDTGAISFVGLIQLLSKHQLYISESGLIARYGKTKGSSNSSRHISVADKLQQFLYNNTTLFIWFLLYLALNLILFTAGVGVYSSNKAIKNTWTMWAYGTGPVLSMNIVLVLLPTLMSLIHAMRSSQWMNVIFPLKKPVTFHIIITIGITFWTVVHLITHLTSFAKDSPQNSFSEGIKRNIVPTVTGLIILITFITMGVSSIKPLRSMLRFIPFRLIHWIGGGLFYVLLLIHGIKYWNPSFWKWLLPALIIFAVERIYRHVIIRRRKVLVKSAGRYDSVSRTAIVELDKPKHLEYEPGQYILLNLPRVGQFEWQVCHISSGPKEEKLTIHIPFSDDIWFKKVCEYLKKHPHNMPQSGGGGRGGGREKNMKLSEVESGEDPANRFPAYFTGPYGTMDTIKQLFKYKISTLLCGGTGPHAAKAVIKKFLDYRKAVACHCGCQPILSKMYFVWVIPSGNDFEWFTDYLSELCEDEHLHHYLDIRVFLTNCDSAPDELASALLQLGLKTAGDKVTARRPSQPQLNNLYHMTSYGVPDFTSLLDYISSHHSSLWTDNQHSQSGVFTVGDFKHSMSRDLLLAIEKSSKPGQITFRHHRIFT